MGLYKKLFILNLLFEFQPAYIFARVIFFFFCHTFHSPSNSPHYCTSAPAGPGTSPREHPAKIISARPKKVKKFIRERYVFAVIPSIITCNGNSRGAAQTDVPTWNSDRSDLAWLRCNDRHQRLNASSQVSDVSVLRGYQLVICTKSKWKCCTKSTANWQFRVGFYTGCLA